MPDHRHSPDTALWVMLVLLVLTVRTCRHNTEIKVLQKAQAERCEVTP